MKFLRFITILSIFSFSAVYASEDPCKGGKEFANKVVKEIVACRKNMSSCSQKNLDEYQKTAKELIEFIDRTNPQVTDECIAIIETAVALKEQKEK